MNRNVCWVFCIYSVLCEYFSYFTLFHPHKQFYKAHNIFFNGVLERYKHNPRTKYKEPQTQTQIWTLKGYLSHSMQISHHTQKRRAAHSSLYTQTSHRIYIQFVCVEPGSSQGKTLLKMFTTQPCLGPTTPTSLNFINNEKAGGAASSAAEHIGPHKARCSSAGITKITTAKNQIQYCEHGHQGRSWTSRWRSAQGSWGLPCSLQVQVHTHTF